MVHTDFQGRGIGRQLMNAVLDLADNWLHLVRVELTVLPQNKKAVQLYSSLGFEVEGTLKYAHLYQGNYADLLIMGRYKHK